MGACCWVFVVGWGLLFAVCCLSVVFCSFVVCCFLFAGRSLWSLIVVRCLLAVVRCLFFVAVSCLLFVDCVVCGF